MKELAVEISEQQSTEFAVHELKLDEQQSVSGGRDLGPRDFVATTMLEAMAVRRQVMVIVESTTGEVD